jgi:hypothetical protein
MPIPPPGYSLRVAESWDPETWGRAAVRAIPIALWILALAVVSIVGVYEWDRWQSVAASYEMDMDPAPRVSEEFPNYHEDTAKRVADATAGFKDIKHELRVHVGKCAALAAGLIAVPFIYRRRVPPEDRPSRRSWLLAVPLILLFGVIGLLWFAAGLAGAIKG